MTSRVLFRVGLPENSFPLCLFITVFFFSVDQEKNVSEKDMSWRELLDSVCSYPTRAYAHLSHRWELASFLWDTTLSVVLKTVELRFCASPSALRYASRRCFGLRIDDVAVQCACQKRIELNAVLQNLLLMVWICNSLASKNRPTL